MVMETTKEKGTNNRGTFCIERFESLMSTTNTTWDELNNEFGSGTKKMLTDKNKEPMLNVVDKCCTYMEIEDAFPYVMCKSNTYGKRKPVMVRNINMKETMYKCDTELVSKLIKKSPWNLITLTELLSISYNNGMYRFRHYKFKMDDVITLCWALKTTPKKLFGIYTGDCDSVPKQRIINAKQKVKLSKEDFIDVDINDLCKRAVIDKRLLNFKNGDILVSENMYIRLDDFKKDKSKRGMKSSINIKINQPVSKKKGTKDMKFNTETNKTVATAVVAENKNDNKYGTTETAPEPKKDDNRFGYTIGSAMPADIYQTRQKPQRPFISNKDVLDRIQHMNDTELAKVEEWIALVRQMRKIKDNI